MTLMSPLCSCDPWDNTETPQETIHQQREQTDQRSLENSRFVPLPFNPCMYSERMREKERLGVRSFTYRENKPKKYHRRKVIRRSGYESSRSTFSIVGKTSCDSRPLRSKPESIQFFPFHWCFYEPLFVELCYSTRRSDSIRTIY